MILHSTSHVFIFGGNKKGIAWGLTLAKGLVKGS